MIVFFHSLQKRFSFLLLSLLLANFLSAQNRITGKILAEEGRQPIVGATIVLKGQSRTTLSDKNGTFSLEGEAGDILTISSQGFMNQEVSALNEPMTIILKSEIKDLSEVIVTALGIRKEKKKLGYAIQELKGDELTVARETNVVNQLAGKVAGVTVVGSPSGIGGSARVTIRGERSVDLNKNQPLYVVDGVPISNSITGGSGRGNLEVDFGNGASFVNPDDIESMTVLKGPAASALYGSRAANGVILIKTKSGKKQKGIGVEASTNLTVETPLKLPEYQTVYGQGNGSGGNFA